MSLEQTIKEIKSLKSFAEENTDVGPAETMNGRRGRKNNAIERISMLKRDYKDQLLRSAFYIIVTGPLRNEFATIATGEKFNLFSADPEDFYNDLAGRVHPTLYTEGNASPSNLFDVLGRHLEDKMRELGVESYNQLIFKEKYVSAVRTAKDFAALLKTAINEQIGAEIVGIQAVNSIVDKAIDKGHTSSYTPIVLVANDETLVTDMLKAIDQAGNKAYLVQAGEVSPKLNGLGMSLEEVTPKTVKQTLTTINSDVKRG